MFYISQNFEQNGMLSPLRRAPRLKSRPNFHDFNNAARYLKVIIDFMQAFASRNTWEWLSACNSSKLAAQDYEREWKLARFAVVFIVHHYPFILFPDSTSIKRSPAEQLHVSRLPERATFSKGHSLH